MRWVVLAAVLCALAACGSERDAVLAAAAAVAAGAGKPQGPEHIKPNASQRTACAAMTAAAQEQVVEETYRVIGVAAETWRRSFDVFALECTCANALAIASGLGVERAAARGLMDEPRAREVPPRPRIVSLNGDRATVRLGTNDKIVQLRRIEGRWRVSALDYSDY